jgi:creatinine amidohydrolase
MRTLCLLLLLFVCIHICNAQVLHFADLNTRDFEKLDRAKTIVIIPGAILEEHGPYLPAGTDGIVNSRFADDLAHAIAISPGWTVLLLPSIPLGAGGANEIGHKFSFPGSCTVRPDSLRSVFMDLADQLGVQHFRWILIVHGHGDPAHNRMLDQAGEYFHDTYGGEMVNLFGYLWVMKLKDFRSADQLRQDGMEEHATMTETSLILALQPRSVAPDYKSAPPQTGQTIQELVVIASKKDWPGYFGAPAIAYESLGHQIYDQWLSVGTDFVKRILSGEDYRKLPRYGDVFAGDPADAEASAVNQQAQLRHENWLKNHTPNLQ